MSAASVIVILAAACTPMLVAHLGGALYRNARARSYSELTDQDVSSAAAPYGIKKETYGADFELLRRSVRSFYLDENEIAASLQAKYHYFVGFAVSAAASAFVVTAVSAAFTADIAWLTLATSVYDMTAFLIVLFCFMRVGPIIRKWVRSRLGAEIARHWFFFDYVLSEQPYEEDITGRYLKFIEEFRHSVGDGSGLAQYWSSRRRELIDKLDKGPGVPLKAASYYLELRPVRQLVWFRKAVIRLESQRGFRDRILAAMYLIALITAIIRIFAYYLNSNEIIEVASLAILLLVGLSAAFTSLYISQNSNALLYRYRSQVRRIEWHLKELSEHGLLERSGDQQKLSDSDSNWFLLWALDFEEFMISELADWTMVTAEEKLELAPG